MAKHIAIITGASAGIGASFTQAVYQQSCRDAFDFGWHKPSASGELRSAGKTRGSRLFDEIWIVARRAERLDALKQTLEQAPSPIPARYAGISSIVVPKIVVIEADLSQIEGIELIADRLQSDESIDVGLLVNNAGYGSYGALSEVDMAFQLGQIDLNCRALTHLCMVALPYMKQGSALVNVASLAAFSPIARFAVYAATKAYVLSLSAALRVELKDRGIRVTAFCPGPLATEFSFVASQGRRSGSGTGRSTDIAVMRTLKQVKKGKFIAIPYFDWKCAAFATRFLGRILCATITMMARPHK